MNTIKIHSKSHDYQVIINENLNNLIKNHLDKNTKYFVVVDKKVNRYSSLISSHCNNAIFYEIEGGEDSKTIAKYDELTKALLDNKITKNDVLIALGGGTITDLVGYTASTYKRGIQYINIPTTTLSMIDSSIGGKTALNISNIKNAVGTIYPPLLVLIGLDTLNTLDNRNFNNGLFEALKVGLTLDKTIYDVFKENKVKENLAEVIYKSLCAKAQIVMQDEKDESIRKVLNFGHTIGHAIELNDNYLHGEAVAIGMLNILKGTSLYSDVSKIIENMGIKATKLENIDKLIDTIKNDKKAHDNLIDIIDLKELEKPEIKSISFDELKRRVS